MQLKSIIKLLTKADAARLVKFLLVILICNCTDGAFAQDGSQNKQLTLDDIYKLALLNSFQLKISQKSVASAKQQTEIYRLAKLPALGSDLEYGYISNAQTWNPSFSDHQSAAIPHHFTAFSAQAAQTVFQGGEIRNIIRRSALQEQVAALDNERNIEDIKLLVSAKYLDIYRLISQQKIYKNNIKLTQNRLKNVLTMQKQGMVTRNDVLRTELTISELKLALRTTNNDITILNQQLNVVTGLPDSTTLVPDSTLLTHRQEDKSLAEYLSQANNVNQDLRISVIANRIAETNIKLLGSDRLPQIFLYARTNLERPYTFSIPAVDIYSNVWQAGIGVHYNISSTYQTKKRIKGGEIELSEARDRETLEKQNLEVSVKSGFIKYKESGDDLVTLTADLNSAEENYRVVEKKYFNQLALLTDMIDATNTKIEAELKVTNAQINIVYTHCQLLHTIGIL